MPSWHGVTLPPIRRICCSPPEAHGALRRAPRHREMPGRFVVCRGHVMGTVGMEWALSVTGGIVAGVAVWLLVALVGNAYPANQFKGHRDQAGRGGAARE